MMLTNLRDADADIAEAIKGSANDERDDLSPPFFPLLYVRCGAVRCGVGEVERCE